MALIVLYTGKGKGKTSACLGQVLRALGHGYAVAFGQFIKRNGQAGEQALLTKLLGGRFRAGGRGFVRQAPDLTPHRKASEELLSWAEEQIPSVFLLVLDEFLYALEYDLLSQESCTRFLNRIEKSSCHLVLSGRFAPDWLVAGADLVTECVPVKHPLQQGIYAYKGIEF